MTTLTLVQGSRLWVEGDSTLHRYKLDATQMRATIDLDPAADAGDLEALVRQHQVRALELQVPVNALRSGESGLDEKMRETLHADRVPAITFRMATYEAGSAAGATIPLRLQGTLSIAGTERQTVVEAQATQSSGGLRVVGRKELHMTEFGLKPPVLMLGVLRVKDAVLVQFDLQIVARSVA